jgi:hypothetical protein
MDGGEDFVMAGPGDGALTSDDYEPVKRNTDFCLLCAYGSTPGQETEMLVNSDIKSLEQIITQLRKSMSIERTAKEVYRYYQENIQHLEPYCNDPEWTVDCIEDHLCRHAAPEATTRGERPGEDMAYEIFSNALHVQSKAIVNKETGLIDERQVKIMCQLADRMYKFMPKARESAGNKAKQFSPSDGF